MNAQPKDGWYNPDATTFGDRVSGAREDCGMTQEELARRIGVKLTELSAEQAAYIGVKPEGPFKPEHYRY